MRIARNRTPFAALLASLFAAASAHPGGARGDDALEGVPDAASALGKELVDMLRSGRFGEATDRVRCQVNFMQASAPRCGVA